MGFGTAAMSDPTEPTTHVIRRTRPTGSSTPGCHTDIIRIHSGRREKIHYTQHNNESNPNLKLPNVGVRRHASADSTKHDCPQWQTPFPEQGSPCTRAGGPRTIHTSLRPTYVTQIHVFIPTV